MQQMPEEGRQFQIVDRLWREVMEFCAEDPKVREISVINRNFSCHFFWMEGMLSFQNMYSELQFQFPRLSRNKVILFFI